MHRSLELRHERFTLNAPFRISRGVKTAADVITVRISAGEATGRGEGVPYARYGETVESVIAAIEAVRDAIQNGAARVVLQSLLPAGAARNAIDCALWDLEARSSIRDVATLIGKPAPGSIVTAMTIGIDTPEAMARAAGAVANVPLLKVKVDADDSEARLRAVRTVVPDARLIVDPNESWDRAVLEAMQDALVELRVDLLEQPVPAGDDAWLEGFVSRVPICADEAVHTVDDLDVVSRRYDYVNIKLDKTGGLTGALELAAAARARGLGLMTGCMISSSLSIAPAMHVAALSDFADLDGPLWLLEDRVGGVTGAGGVLAPPSPGFWGGA